MLSKLGVQTQYGYPAEKIKLSQRGILTNTVELPAKKFLWRWDKLIKKKRYVLFLIKLWFLCILNMHSNFIWWVHYSVRLSVRLHCYDCFWSFLDLYHTCDVLWAFVIYRDLSLVTVSNLGSNIFLTFFAIGFHSSHLLLRMLVVCIFDCHLNEVLY